MANIVTVGVALVAVVVGIVAVTVAIQPPAIFAYFAGFACLVAVLLGWKAYTTEESRYGGDGGA